MTNLPEDFVPFKTMIICTNEFVGGRVPIDVEGHPVFLVGKNDPSRTWLYAPFEVDGKREWQCLVSGNESRHSRAMVITSDNSTGIIWRDEQVIHVVAYPEDDRCEIPSLDFRPLGLDIHGDIGGLRISGNTVVGTHMSGVATLVKVG